MKKATELCSRVVLVRRPFAERINDFLYISVRMDEECDRLVAVREEIVS